MLKINIVFERIMIRLNSCMIMPDKIMIEALELISLSRLRIFLAICETPHLARTAERLGVTQPALSQKLRNLEDALRVKLFDRQHRRLELTPAGKVCKTEAEKILSLHKVMVEKIRQAARGYAGKINFGYVPSAIYGRTLVSQLKAVNEKFPDFEIALHQQNPLSLISALEKGSLDVAFICARMSIPESLVYKFHSRQELLIALPKGHNLTRLEKIPFSLLENENLIAPQGPNDIGIMSVIISAAEKINLHLSIKSYIPELNGVLSLVSAGYGYSVIPEDLTHSFNESIEYRKFCEPNIYIEYWIVWNELNSFSASTDFIETLITQ